MVESIGGGKKWKLDHSEIIWCKIQYKVSNPAVPDVTKILTVISVSTKVCNKEHYSTGLGR